MPELYPLLFSPILKDYLWGGRNLENFGRNLPTYKRIAESWEIASHADGMTLVKNGVYAGMSLPEMLSLWGTDLVGSNNQWAKERGIFPLMVKLLDAEQKLSVQVHPNDAYAHEHVSPNELGKAEMWVVLHAEPGAGVIYGFSQETSANKLKQAIQEAAVAPLLNIIPVQAGDHICVPPGTLHAILGGVILVEIQQNSNTTYRVFDWNRTDESGEQRALHIDQALDVINFNQINVQRPIPEVVENTANWCVERLCDHTYFTTDRITYKKESRHTFYCDGSTFEIWGVIKGRAEIAHIAMEEIMFCLLPAGLGFFSVNAAEDSVLLRVFTS